MSGDAIGFAGMTHLGLNSAVAAADRGFDVVCYDADAKLVTALGRGELPVLEPDLPELLRKNAHHIRFVADPQALAVCSLVYVASDVPTDDDGRSDLACIDALIGQVDAVLPSDVVVVILSQVPPGYTRECKRGRAGRRLHYQVETLIFGRAMERARFPERFIVGCAEPAQPLPPALARFLESFGCPVLLMRYESAELAKISINMCLVASVSAANTLAELCECIGADWSEIAPALKLDKRIGPHAYLAPGLGIAGGNLERDLATVCSMADRHGTDAGVVRAWFANSRHRKEWAWRTLDKLILSRQPDAKLAVLGLAYKEDTHSTKNSPALALLSRLRGRSVTVFDPVVSPADADIPFKAAASAMEAIQDADAVCIMTPWSEFRKLSPQDLAKSMRGHWLIDPYRMLDGGAALAAGLQHVTLGAATEAF
jgi:UDPglucose 6-dehydrogenase